MHIVLWPLVQDLYACIFCVGSKNSPLQSTNTLHSHILLHSLNPFTENVQQGRGGVIYTHTVCFHLDLCNMHAMQTQSYMTRLIHNTVNTPHTAKRNWLFYQFATPNVSCRFCLSSSLMGPFLPVASLWLLYTIRAASQIWLRKWETFNDEGSYHQWNRPTAPGFSLHQQNRVWGIWHAINIDTSDDSSVVEHC